MEQQGKSPARTSRSIKSYFSPITCKTKRSISKDNTCRGTDATASKKILTKESEDVIDLMSSDEEHKSVNHCSFSNDISEFPRKRKLENENESSVKNLKVEIKQQQFQDDNNDLDQVETQTITELYKKYPYKQSAYLMHIAEICHTILYDIRWEGLFSPEFDGESFDLLKAFASQHLHIPELPCTDDIVENVNISRALHLYGKLLMRKGPWFRIDDLYRRYYKNYDLSLKDLTDDLLYLTNKNWFRTFHDEFECAKEIDKGGILFNKQERSAVRSKIGAGTSDNADFSFEQQIKSQLKIHRYFDANEASMQKNLSLCENLNELILSTISNYTGKNEKQPLTCIRFSQKPLYLLRRCLRLYLIATAGCGQMRSYENAWCSIFDNLDYSRRWDKLRYPGLQHRLRLVLFDFTSLYKPLPTRKRSSIMEKYNIKLMHVFRTRDDFLRWELSVEFRAFIEFQLESLELGKSSHYSSNIETAKEGIIDVLSREGREQIFHAYFFEIPDFPQSKLDDLEGTILKFRQTQQTTDDITCYEDRILISCLIIMHILKFRLQNIAENYQNIIQKPWLRHLTSEAILLYLLWDGIELFEKRHYYQFAVQILETMVIHTNEQVETLLQVSLSRRTRGKIFERLIIDRNHAWRQGIGNKNTSKNVSKIHMMQEANFVQQLVKRLGLYGSIPFSALRNLSKKTQKFRSTSLETFLDNNNIWNSEVMELGIRLSILCDEPKTKKIIIGNRRPWKPYIDYIKANAITNESKNTKTRGIGRCHYVGREDDLGNAGIFHRSLSVEELALEEYNLGKNINSVSSKSSYGHGFIGWHDEGGVVRALYRILSSETLLSYESNTWEDYVIFLTPYQSSPLDLHVAQMNVSDGCSTATTVLSSFYERRRVLLEHFLKLIENLTADEMVNFVYENIMRRLDRAVSHKLRADQNSIPTYQLSKDEFLLRDLQQLRTLSMIAAGIGGQVLSCIFRTLCWDYRHYCGGLPDLILCRACYADNDSEEDELVNLGDWIGEGFSLSESIKQPRNMREKNEISNFFFDRDDEFLGCSKNGDSHKISSSNSIKYRQSQSSGMHPTLDSKSESEAQEEETLELPKCLKLCHKSRQVKVECMFVEVKSLNDKLDGRQEDWLNIIDRHGVARVCQVKNVT